MKNVVQKQIVTITLLVVALFPVSHAQQNYPTRPVRLIVTVPPGGAADLVARVMAQKLGDAMGQTFVADNRGGGEGGLNFSPSGT